MVHMDNTLPQGALPVGYYREILTSPKEVPFYACSIERVAMFLKWKKKVLFYTSGPVARMEFKLTMYLRVGWKFKLVFFLSRNAAREIQNGSPNQSQMKVYTYMYV